MREIFETLLALDVVNFSARLTVLLMDDDRSDVLVKRREEAAQSLLNILQAVSRLAFPGPTTSM